MMSLEVPFLAMEGVEVEQTVSCHQSVNGAPADGSVPVDGIYERTLYQSGRKSN